MRRGVCSATLLATIVAASACHPADAAKVIRADSAELAKREQRLDQALAHGPDSVRLDTTAIDSLLADSMAAPDTVAKAFGEEHFRPTATVTTY